MNRRWPDYRTRLIGRCGRSWARGRSPTSGPYCTSRRAQCQGFRLNISTRISFRAVGPSLLIIAEDSLPEVRGAVVTSFPLDYLLSPLGPVGADEPYSPPALYGKWELQLDHLTWALTISDTLAPPVSVPPPRRRSKAGVPLDWCQPYSTFLTIYLRPLEPYQLNALSPYYSREALLM